MTDEMRRQVTLDAAWLQQQFPTISNLTPLNHGGQKWVFGGTHPVNGSIVLKFFHPQSDPDRAIREVQAVFTIQSARVPRIYEAGVAACNIGPLIWVREERLQGQNLRERLQAGTLDPAAAMRLALHILEALAAAEQHHIVHRDVKPENIIVDQAGNFWLLDFGLARHLDKESLTATGQQEPAWPLVRLLAKALGVRCDAFEPRPGDGKAHAAKRGRPKKG